MNLLQKLRSIYFTILDVAYQKRAEDPGWPLTPVTRFIGGLSGTTRFTLMTVAIVGTMVFAVYQLGGKEVVRSARDLSSGTFSFGTPEETREYQAYIPNERGVALAMMPMTAIAFEFGKSGPSVRITDLNNNVETIKLSLRGYGFHGMPAPIKGAATMKKFPNRTEYRRDKLTEWYVFDAYGLEQGFTLWHPPEGMPAKKKWGWFKKQEKTDEGIVMLQLAIDTALKLEVDKNYGGISLLSEDGELRMRYSKILAWDDTGRLLPVTVDVNQPKKATPYIELYVDVSDAIWPIIVN